MDLKYILPNCLFFDEYSEENVPIGGVRCADWTKCAKCGFNPVVRSARIEKIRENRQKRSSSKE